MLAGLVGFLSLFDRRVSFVHRDQLSEPRPVGLRANPKEGDGDDRQDRRDERDADTSGRLQASLTRIPLIAGLDQVPPQFRVLAILPFQQ